MARVPVDVTRRTRPGPTVLAAPLFIFDRGTEDEVDVYDAETAGSVVTQPLSANAEGHYPDCWVAAGSYDLHAPNDLTEPTQPWEAVVGIDSGSLAVVREAPLHVKDPVYGGAVGDGVADDTAEVQAALSDLAAGQTLDLDGGTYKVTSGLTLATDFTKLQNGKILAGQHTALTVSGDDVTTRDVRFERSTSHTGADTTAARSLVVVSGARFRSYNSDYTNASQACLMFTNGLCNGSRVFGGRFQNSSARQDSACIYGQAGASGNVDIQVHGAEVSGACAMGVTIYEAQYCKVNGNAVSGMAELPRLNLTTWVLVSGNVYSTTDRTDGSTRMLLNNGVQLVEETGTPTAPGSNEFGVSGGTIYVNLGGTDPNSRTMESRITSGYGTTFYTTGVAVIGNMAAHNSIRDVDGFGIYFQLNASDQGNGTIENVIVNACTSGIQNSSLPFAGLAVSRGLNTMLVGDRLTGCGGNAGVNLVNDATGTALGVVSNDHLTNHGFRVFTPGWRLIGCHAHDNAVHGFLAITSVAEPTLTGISLTDCSATGNASRGVYADNTLGTTLEVTVFGGLYENNTAGQVVYSATATSKAMVYGAKPVVSGSRAGNAALADLLTELATLGVITDSSSA